MQNPLLKKALPVLICVFAIGIGVMTALTAKKPPEKLEISGFAFPEPKALVDIHLIDQDTEAFTEEAFKDSWTFVYVGYTFCPDACPMSLTTMNQIHGILDKQQNAENLQLLLVSVDPQRDSPERLLEYTRYFNDSFLAATGTDPNIKDFTTQVSAIYSLPDDRSDPNYLVDHSSSIILINPEAKVHAIFTPPQSASDLAEDFVKLKERYRSHS